MIGYDSLRVRDISFYWEDSILFYKGRDGMWVPVMFSHVHIDGASYDDVRHDYLDDAEETDNYEIRLVFTILSHNDTEAVPPREITCKLRAPFESADWITHRLETGWMYTKGGGLMYTSTEVPRSRMKGTRVGGSSRTVTVLEVLGDEGPFAGRATDVASGTALRLNHGYKHCLRSAGDAFPEDALRLDPWHAYMDEVKYMILGPQLCITDGLLRYYNDPVANVKLVGDTLVLTGLKEGVHYEALNRANRSDLSIDIKQ